MSEKKWFVLFVMLLMALGILVFMAFTFKGNECVIYKPLLVHDKSTETDLLLKRIKHTVNLLEDAKIHINKLNTTSDDVKSDAIFTFDRAIEQLKGEHDDFPIEGVRFGWVCSVGKSEKKGE